MAKPKTLREIAGITSTEQFFSSFTSEAQDERKYEEYLRGPTYDDVYPAESRGATPVPWDRDESPWRSVGHNSVGPVEGNDSDSDDDVVPSIELPEDLGDLIQNSTQDGAVLSKSGPSRLPDTVCLADLVKAKGRRGGRIGKLAHNKTRPLIDKLLAKAAKTSAAGSTDDATPRNTYRVIDQRMLAEVEQFDDNEFVEYPDDEGSCLVS